MLVIEKHYIYGKWASVKDVEVDPAKETVTYIPEKWLNDTFVY